jgi:hypothetical protein
MFRRVHIWMLAGLWNRLWTVPCAIMRQTSLSIVFPFRCLDNTILGCSASVGRTHGSKRKLNQWRVVNLLYFLSCPIYAWLSGLNGVLEYEICRAAGHTRHAAVVPPGGRAALNIREL